MKFELLASRFLLQNACRHGWGYRRLAAGLRLVGAGILTIMLLFPASLQAGGPTDQLCATVDKVLVIVRNANPKSPSQKKDLHAQLVEIIYPRFDFGEMAKRSLGLQWGRPTAAEQREFVELLTELLARS